MKQLANRNTKSPGEDVEVRLRLRGFSLNLLTERGVKGEVLRLVDNRDGTYGLQTVGGRIGETRDQGIKPAADKLTELINTFAEEVEGVDLPQVVDDAWGRLLDAWNAYDGEKAA